MLTNVFYYNLYRPYIVGSRESNDITHKRSRIAETTPQDKIDRGMTIVLNKSLKAEIVRHVRSISHGVTGFKTSLNRLLNDMGGFGLNAMYNGYDSAVYDVEKGLASVVDAYNKGTPFLERQEQSSELRDFSQSVRERMYQGSERLGLLGISFDEESNAMQFDPSVLQSLSQFELHSAIGANIQVFHSLHQTTTDVLTAPLSAHLGFRGLSYHYNYQLGRIVEDGFGIIESGMIIDRVV